MERGGLPIPARKLVPAVGKENGSFLRDGHRPGTAGKTAEITHIRGMINQESVEPSLPETLLQPLQTAFMVHRVQFNNIWQRPLNTQNQVALHTNG